MSKNPGADRCVRAMTNDGGFRLIAVSLEQTASEVAEAQKISDSAKAEIAGPLSELLVASILLRETTSPSRRVQIALRKQDGSRWVADSLADGLTRGLVTEGDPGESYAQTRMEVTYTQKNGALHQGIVAIDPPSEKGLDVSSSMMTYLQESEQILSTMAVAAARSAKTPLGWVAVGYVVQLLPELARADLETMTARLSAMEPLGSTLAKGVLPTPEQLIEPIFDGWDYTILADSPIRFGCPCTRERFVAGIGTLPPKEISAMIEENQPLELRCDACGQTYSIQPKELNGFVDR